MSERAPLNSQNLDRGQEEEGFFGTAFRFIKRLINKSCKEHAFYFISVPSNYRSSEPGEEFFTLFEKKFAQMPRPKFLQCKIEEAIKIASSQKKPLLIYMQNSEQMQNTEEFVMLTIGNPDAILMIVKYFDIKSIE